MSDASVLLLLPLLSLLRPSGADEPPANLTALNEEPAAPWVKEPDGRGTWGLVYGCLFTIFLCVWTAVHVNIPPRDIKPRKRWLRKLYLVLVAVLAPEAVLYIAFCERQEAYALKKHLNAAWEKQVRCIMDVVVRQTVVF